MEFFDGINHPSAATVIADGLSGGMLYGGTPADSLGKDFTAAQYADYKAHGLFVGLVYESVAGDFLGGMAAGIAHAQALWNDCAAKGVNISDPACSTVDEHVAAGDLPTVVAYQRAFRDELRALGWTGPIGIYGFPETTQACHDAGVADWFWGAGTRSSQPAFINVWQDNTGTIQVGGSADDQDWVLVPLPTGGSMTTPADIWGYPIVSPDGKTSFPAGIWLGYADTYAGQAAAQLATVSSALTALATAVAATDADVKAASTQEASDHAATLTAISKVAAIDPTVLEQDIQAALTAAGWVPPPTAAQNAAVVAPAVLALIASKLGGAA